MSQFKLFFVLAGFGLHLSCFAQQGCLDYDDPPKFDVIFGGDRVTAGGNDTIQLDRYRRIIYSCHDCTLKCIGIENSTEWVFDLSKIGCQLYSLYQLKTGSEIRGFDIIFDTRGKFTYGLKSKNGNVGKIRRWSSTKIMNWLRKKSTGAG